MKIKLQESNLLNLLDNKAQVNGWEINSVEWIKLYECWATATQTYLNLVKDKNQKTALVFSDSSEEHNFLIAGLIEYHPNEDGEVGGNWSFSYTLDPQDLTGAKTIFNNDPQFISTFNDVSRSSLKDPNGTPCGFVLDVAYASQIFDELISMLLQYLDTNADPKDALDLELEDHFIATVEFDEGKKFIAIVPEGKAKTKIKNDDEVSEGLV